MKCGDIFLIPFPFSELTQVKVRPAVVITETKDKFADLVLAGITSQVPNTLQEREILLSPSHANGLRVLSVIKVDRIFTLKRQKVIHHLGRIAEKELAKFKNTVRSLVD